MYSVGNGWLRDGLARYGDGFDSTIGGALDRYLHERATRAADLVAHFQRKLPGHLHAVYGDNSITEAQVRRAPRANFRR